MSRIREFDGIRLTVPMTGEDVFDKTRAFSLPAGTEGAVVEVLGDNEAYEVEVLVYPDPTDPEYFTSVMLTVAADQCEPA